MNEYLESLRLWFQGNSTPPPLARNGYHEPLLPIAVGAATINDAQMAFVDDFCKRIRLVSGREALFVTDLMLGISYGYNKRKARCWWIQNGHFLAKFCIEQYDLRYISKCMHPCGNFFIYSNADIRDCMNRIILLFERHGKTLTPIERVPWDPKYDDSTEKGVTIFQPQESSSSPSPSSSDDEEDKRTFTELNSIVVIGEETNHTTKPTKGD